MHKHFNNIENMPYALLFDELKYMNINYIYQNFNIDNSKISKLVSDPRYWIGIMGCNFVINKPTNLSYYEWYDIYTKYSDQPPTFEEIIDIDNRKLLAINKLYPIDDENFWIQKMGPDFIALQPENFTFHQWLETVITNNLLTDYLEDFYYGCQNGIYSLVENSLNNVTSQDKLSQGMDLSLNAGHHDIYNYLKNIPI